LTIIVGSLAALAGFLFGFSQYPSAETATLYAVIVGIASSAAWGAAALGGFYPGLGFHNNFANLFAAAFAAASLGYLTGPDQFCDKADGRAAWKGKNWFLAVPCQLRYFPEPSTPEWELNFSTLAANLGTDERELREALQRISALERRLKDNGQVPGPQPSAPRSPSPRGD
jgi:hypothetical protein